MSTYAFVATASNERYRAEAANLILSSKAWGDYTWYLVADKPLGIGERFIQMPPNEQAQWASKGDGKFLLRYSSIEQAFAAEPNGPTYVIHIDADCVFRGSPAISRLILQNRPAFALLEGNMLHDGRAWFWTTQERTRWLEKLPRIHADVFYNLNGGFLGIRRDCFSEFMALVDRAIAASVKVGLRPCSWRSEEPYTSYAIHQMNEDLSGLMIDRNLDVFLYTGNYPERPAAFENWGTGKMMLCPVGLGIVHVFNKHDLLAADGRAKMAALGKPHV
jgi:hypothetical protein